MSDSNLLPVLSVIIPVYNTAAYLPECLESVLSLTVPLEVIIVNDGSTDKSGAVIRDYCARFANIKAIGQPNSGLSMARNAGLDEAVGEYILFVDSDDILIPDGLVKMVTAALSHTPDIVVGKVESFWEDGRTKIWRSPLLPSSKCVTGRDMLGLMMREGFVPMVFDYMCRRDFIVRNNFRFIPGILHEDELWTPMMMTSAETVAVTDAVHYRYRQRSGSITDSSFGEERFFSIAKIVHLLLDGIQGCQDSHDHCSSFNLSFMWWRVSVLLQIMKGIAFPAGELVIGQLLGRMSLLLPSPMPYVSDFSLNHICGYLDNAAKSDAVPC